MTLHSPCTTSLSVRRPFITRHIVVVITLILVAARAWTAEAATRTWTGLGSSNNWSEAANWDSGAPVDGDSLVFPAGVMKTTSTNNLADRLILSITFGVTFTQIEGNAFRLGGGGLQVPAAPATIIIKTPIQLDADQMWRPAGSFGLDTTATLSLNGHTLTVEVHEFDQASLSGVVSGNGTIVNAGASGQLSLFGVNTFTGSVVVNTGTLFVAQGATPAPITVNAIGTLSLFGGATVGAINVNGGRVQTVVNGTAASTAASLTMSGASTFDVDAARNPFRLGRIDTPGPVTLANSTLRMTMPGLFTPPLGTPFTIIDQAGSAPVNGTFAGLPEGAFVTFDAVTFRVSYTAGTGNDVVLTVVSVSVPGTYFLSEGATGSFFHTDILIANIEDVNLPCTLTFLKEDGTTVVRNEVIPALSRKTIHVGDIPGMESASFSTRVESNGTPIIVERTMYWDASGYGSHTEHAVDGASPQWYFAEGSQSAFFHTYLLLTNPQTAANSVTVTYLREFEAPLTRTYPMAPQSRLTIDAATDPELVNRSFGMQVDFAQPGTAERAMYFGTSPLFSGGHESAGVTLPASTWFLAEGATGPFFETFVLLANPGATDATVTLTYLPSMGLPVTATKVVPAHGRLSVNLEGENPSLANAAVATAVQSSQPIIVERSQYWPDPAPNWYEAHNSFGVPALGTHWGLAEGRVGGANDAQTFILLANPGPVPAEVRIRFLREDDQESIPREFVVPPTSRLNVRVGPGTEVPELTNVNFGADIVSNQPIAVERALYWNANGVTFAAGSNATAMRLP